MTAHHNFWEELALWIWLVQMDKQETPYTVRPRLYYIMLYYELYCLDD